MDGHKINESHTTFKTPLPNYEKGETSNTQNDKGKEKVNYAHAYDKGKEKVNYATSNSRQYNIMNQLQNPCTDINTRAPKTLTNA